MRCFLALAVVLVACRTNSGTVSPSGSGGPTLTYLGVAGWSLGASAGTLLVDPYVTRVKVEDEGQLLVTDEAAIAAYTPARVDVVLVGHSHYDHVLDVPAIARRTGATVVGTQSTANLARAGGVAEDKIVVTQGGQTRSFGPFVVRTVAGLHSLTGQADEPIAREIALPMAARGYGEGGTLHYLVEFAGRRVLFVGTANFVEAAMVGLRPDVAVVAVGLRDKVPDYTCRLLRALDRPPLVVPNHFDEFREPLRPGSEPSEETREDLEAFAVEVHACAPEARVVVPSPLRPIAL
jgi:L-ascorbate metabolism protein UlaG (beta-lactamase superfamily)